MSIFVDKTPVAVTIDGKNIVYIRPRMGYGIEQKVIGAASKVVTGGKDVDGKDVDNTVEINIGSYNLALLVNNILSWEGPDFKGVPCNAENIGFLNDEDPLIEQVLKEINERNKGKGKEETVKVADDGAIEGEYTEVVASPNSHNGGSNGLRALPKKAQESTTSTSSV